MTIAGLPDNFRFWTGKDFSPDREAAEVYTSYELGAKKRSELYEKYNYDFQFLNFGEGLIIATQINE